MKDAALIVAILGVAYLLMRDRTDNSQSSNTEDRVLNRMQRGLSAGFSLGREAKSLYESIF